MTIINKETLVPIGVAAAIIVAGFGFIGWLNNVYLTAQANEQSLKVNASEIEKIKKEQNTFSIQVIEKLTRIEERVNLLIEERGK